MIRFGKIGNGKTIIRNCLPLILFLTYILHSFDSYPNLNLIIIACRCYLKSRLEGISPQATWVPDSHQYEASFVSEHEAARITAVTIITDIFHASYLWDINVLNKEKPPKNTLIYSEKSKFHAMDQANAMIRSEKSWHQKKIGSLYGDNGDGEGDDGSTLPSLRENDEEIDEFDNNSFLSSPLKSPPHHRKSSGHDLLDLAGKLTVLYYCLLYSTVPSLYCTVPSFYGKLTLLY